MHEEETVIGEIGAVDNTKSVLQLETRYLSQASSSVFRRLQIIDLPKWVRRNWEDLLSVADSQLNSSRIRTYNKSLQ